MADKQEAYLSKSKSGKCGFFTGNYLSHPLTDAEYDDLTKNPEKEKLKAKQLNYVLVNKVKEAKSNFHHGGKSNSSVYDGDKALKAKSTKELDELIKKYGTQTSSTMMKAYIAKAKAERARRVGVKEDVEVKFSVLIDLLNEFETPGLKLGALKLDTQDNCIYVTIGGQKYKYTLNVADKAGEVYASVTGMAKHSTGKALAFLKKNATGEKLNEEVEELEEAVFPETHYTWFEVTAPMINLERRSKMEHIAKGEVIGIRRATSTDGKYRLITKKRGPTIIFSVERTEYDKLKKQFKPLKGSLND